MPRLNFAGLNAKAQQINYFIKNAFGFGGVNCSLVFGRFPQ